MNPVVRVVYAEDNAFDADLTRTHFSECAPDFEIEVVKTGGACLEAVARSSPDLLLLDHHLPDMDGLDVLRAVVKSRIDLPVVLVTGVGDEDLVVMALRVGAAYYVPKLGNYLEALPGLLRNVVAEHRQRSLRRLSPAPRRVLYVEHIAADVELTRQHCAEVAPHLELDVVCSCAVALERLRQPLPYDVALIDLRMPDQSGLDFVREARSRHLPLPPFIMLSGKGDEAAAMASLRLGAAEYVIKRAGYLEQLTYSIDRVIAYNHLDHAHARLQEELQERSRVEALLRSQKMLLESQSEASIDGILNIDVNGRVLWHNRRLGEMWGVSPEVLEARSAEALLAVISAHVQDPEGLMRRVREIDLDRTARSWDEIRLLDGRVFDGHSAPMTDDAGAYLGRVWLFRDVSEERNLRTSVAQSDRLASMGMLAASVAHEINNPLSYVLNNIEIVASELLQLSELAKTRRSPAPIGTEDPTGDGAPIARLPEALGEMSERLGDALAGTLRIREITRGLRAFSRVEQTDVVPVDIHNAIEHAATMAFNEIKYRARLVKEFSSVPVVLASEGKLAQVFLNLLVNAAHAIDEGHVDENEIRVRTWSEGDRVFAEVSDTGHGVAPEHQSKIFQPFFTTKGVGVGSGLGLSICQDIIRGFGGDITFTSQVGRGTRFAIQLPRSTQGRIPSRDPGGRQASSQCAVRGRILVIDDEDAVRNVIARLLGREHDVVAVASGEEGRALLQTDPAFDLILCDLMMPRMSGMELHAWLSETNPLLAKRVVFTTGGAFTRRAAQYLAQVGNPRLEKPFDRASLTRVTNDLILATREERTVDLVDAPSATDSDVGSMS